MNKFLNFFTTILFISTAILISCGGGDDPVDEVNVQDVQGALVAKGPTQDGATVSVDGVASGDWANFTTTFTYSTTANADGTKGGSFITSGSASTLVWPADGTWNFVGTDTKQIKRSDGVIMDVSVTETNLTLTFDITDPNGRLLTFGGKWIFGMTF